MTGRHTPMAGGLWPLVGRTEELGLIEQALHDDRIRGLVLAGEAGVGKTRLAHEVLHRAEAAGYASCWVVANSGSTSLPLGAFAPLLPNLSGVAQMELLGRIAAHVISRSGERRLLLAVDDAHLLDETSVALVHQLAVSDAAFVVLTVRRGVGVPEPITALWKDGLAERVEVKALSRAESDELVAAVLGGQVDGITLHDLYELTRGNALFLRELVFGGLASESLTSSGGLWRWMGTIQPAPRLVELVEARLGQLDATSRAALELVAFGEPMPVSVFGRIGNGTVGSLEKLEAAGLLDIDTEGPGLPVRLAHPLYGEVLRAETPPLRARTVFRQLAQGLSADVLHDSTDALRIALWRLAAGDQSEPQELTAAARKAMQAMDNHRAEQLARAAERAGGGTPARYILALGLAGQGRALEAESVFTGINPRAATEAEHVAIVTDRAINLQWRLNRPALAEQVLTQSIATTVDKQLRDQLVTVRAGFLSHDLECGEALEMVQPILDDPRAGDLARLRAFAVATEALAAIGRCESAADTARQGLDLAQRVPEADPLIRLTLESGRLSATLWSGRVDKAQELADAGYRQALARHSSFEAAAFGGWLAAVARVQGSLRVAQSLQREAIGRGRAPDVRGYRRFLPWLLTEFARTSAMLGEAAVAEAALDEVQSLDTGSSRIVDFWVGLAQPWTVAARGERSRAVDLALRLAERGAELGLVHFELVALHDAARLDAAAEVAPLLSRLAGRVEGRFAAVCAAHANALAAGDGVALDEVAERFAGLGTELIAAEAAAQAAVTHRRNGVTGTAMTSAGRARTWASHCQGARTPALNLLEAPPELTRREREIAQLAAQGCSSKAIAERLVISVRTVDNALHDIYAKLGINRRVDLAPIFGQ